MKKRFFFVTTWIIIFGAPSVLLVYSQNGDNRDSSEAVTPVGKSWNASQAEKADRQLAGGKCPEKGSALLTALPMKTSTSSPPVPVGNTTSVKNNPSVDPAKKDKLKKDLVAQ